MRLFYFAWVDPNTPFNPAVHNRQDESIVDTSLEQLEGEFANVTVTVKNPRIGLLASTRKVWAWISENLDGVITPLFLGRLLALPTNLRASRVDLLFTARPIDFVTQKEMLAGTLRELPDYDPVFVKPEKRDDPDSALEAVTKVWHIDRVTHEVTTSDLMIGEDGIEEFQEYEVPRESVQVTMDQPPVRRVHVEATVNWTQEPHGFINGFSNFEVDTLAGKGMISGWPKDGADLGGGWFANDPLAQSPFESLTDTDFLSGDPGVPIALKVVSAFSVSVSPGDVTSSNTTFAIIADKVFCQLNFEYKASRQCQETVIFDLVADHQDLVTMPDESEFLDIKLSGVDVGTRLDPLDEYSEVPIGSALSRSYFPQARGRQSLKYLISLARANIVVRARAVKITFKCKFDRVKTLSLRKNALLHDRELPGGQAIGKIVGVGYHIGAGEISGVVTMLCTVGYGGTVVAQRGTPTIVDDGVLADGIQERTDVRLVLGSDDVGFEPLHSNPADDGLQFPLGSPPWLNSPHAVTVETKGLQPVPGEIQSSTGQDDCGNTTSISQSGTLDTGPYTEWLSGIRSTIDFALPDLNAGPFYTTYQLNVTNLELPKQLDLEAAST